MAYWTSALVLKWQSPRYFSDGWKRWKSVDARFGLYEEYFSISIGNTNIALIHFSFKLIVFILFYMHVTQNCSSFRKHNMEFVPKTDYQNFFACQINFFTCHVLLTYHRFTIPDLGGHCLKSDTVFIKPSLSLHGHNPDFYMCFDLWMEEMFGKP